MKNKKLIITIILSVLITLAVVFAVLFGIKIYQNKLVESGYSETPNSANQYAKDVTMIQLIATPEKYDGQLVRVIGVGNLEFEGNCISLSKEDLKYGVGNSIWIELGEKAISYEEAQRYNGEYVIIEGVFDKDDCGHMDMFCGSIKNISRYDLWDSYFITHSMITQQAEKTYSYEITDYKGRILAYEDNLTREPKRQKVSTDVVGISVQTGTGLSANYATYFDLENSKISETFYYVLAAKDDYVVRADYRDGEHYIVVQDIFDKEQYYQEYKLENVSPVAADFVVDGYFNTKGNVNITYLSGDDYTETNYTIVILPKGKAE